MRRGILGEVGLFAGSFAPPGWSRGELPEPVPHVHPIICTDGMTPSAEQSANPTGATLAEIRLLAGAITPWEWFECSGQLLPLAQHTALRSLIGTTFGGDGTRTIALPDLPAPSGHRYILAYSGAYPEFRGRLGDEPDGQTVGEIRLWPSERLPFGWAPCDGRALQVGQYSPLYAVIGTTFGGDERSRPAPDSPFNLPRIAPPLRGVRFVICINGTFPVRP